MIFPRCPGCDARVRTRVVKVKIRANWIFRARDCESCGARFTTREESAPRLTPGRVAEGDWRGPQLAEAK